MEVTDDSAAATTMVPIIREFSPVPVNLTTVTPICWANPVWNIAAPMTNIAANRTTVELDRPENTVFIGMMPKMPQAIAPAIAVTARGSNSVTKKNATKARIIRVIVALSN